MHAGWLTALDAEVPAGSSWLRPVELEVLDGLSILKRRSDWRLGRWAAKRAVASWLSCDVGQVEIVAADDGAPEALVDGTSAPISLSLSHRAGRALALVGEPGRPLGCDLELVEPRSDAFVQTWLAAGEQRLVAEAPEADRSGVANLLWSAKEAAAKARRQGLRLDVRQAGVDLGSPRSDGWAPMRVIWSEERLETDGWWRQDGEFIITVTARGPEPPQRLA